MGENVSNVIIVIRRLLLSKRLPAACCAFVQFVIDPQMNEKNGYQYYIIMMCDIRAAKPRIWRLRMAARGRPSTKYTLPSPVKNSIATQPPLAAQRPCLESASSRLFISLPSYPRRITSLSFYYPSPPPHSTAMSCPSDNSQAIDQSSFWSAGMHWDSHRIGWAIAGGCSTLVRAISLCPKNLSSSFHSPDCRLYSSLLLLSSTTVGMPPSLRPSSYEGAHIP
jgi:hypothetical protein